MAAMAPARIMAAFSPDELLSAVPKFGEPFIVSKFPPRVTNVDPIPFVLCHVGRANLRDAAGGCPWGIDTGIINLSHSSSDVLRRGCVISLVRFSHGLDGHGNLNVPRRVLNPLGKLFYLALLCEFLPLPL
jgi:hypothetical protein